MCDECFGKIEISNNHVESAIRPIVVRRKNWQYFETKGGYNVSVIVYRIGDCKGQQPESSGLPDTSGDGATGATHRRFPSTS